MINPEINHSRVIYALWPLPRPSPKMGGGRFHEKKHCLRALARKQCFFSCILPPPKAVGVGGGSRGWVFGP